MANMGGGGGGDKLLILIIPEEGVEENNREFIGSCRRCGAHKVCTSRSHCSRIEFRSTFNGHGGRGDGSPRLA